jgi:hypothetical protein
VKNKENNTKEEENGINRDMRQMITGRGRSKRRDACSQFFGSTDLGSAAATPRNGSVRLPNK